MIQFNFISFRFVLSCLVLLYSEVKSLSFWLAMLMSIDRLDNIHEMIKL